MGHNLLFRGALMRLTVAGLVAVLIAGAFPGPGATAQEEPPMRVMTYNIQHGAGNDDCEDPEVPEGEVPPTECAVDLERTAEFISAQGAAVVGLQEVDQFWARSGGVDQAAELGAMTGMEHCFGPNLIREPGESGEQEHYYGTAILSDHPILSCENTAIPTSDGWEPRGILQARISVPGLGEIVVLNTHMQAGSDDEPDGPEAQRTEGAEMLVDMARDIDVPVIVMGDFNAQPDDPELASMYGSDSGLEDAWAAGGGEGEGFTFPANLDGEPETRIDYIFVTEDVSVDAVEVVLDDDARMTSDHYPVVADVTLAESMGTPAAPPPAEATPTDGTPPVVIEPEGTPVDDETEPDPDATPIGS